jgi:group I intron endonuclease
MGHIYKISNNIDERVYIGSTINLHKRWLEHKKDLSNNNHGNLHLQRFVNKYGINSLIFDVIEEVEDEKLLIKEQYYLDTIDNKFNIALDASAPMRGKLHTKESKEKIGIHSNGKNNPMYGKKRPQWLIDKLTESSTGRNKSEKEKILRMINLPNRVEIILSQNHNKIICFSISHASKTLGVSFQAISKALKYGTKSKGWYVQKPKEIFYNKIILLNNIHLFDENIHPQPELIEMLKRIQNM